MPPEIVLLSYDDVTPNNLMSLRDAASCRGIALTEWLPHRISIWCDGRRSIPLYENMTYQPRCILHRTIARLKGIVLPALKLWNQEGTVVLNDPDASALSRDKLATAQCLTEAGVPMVPSLGFFPWEAVDLGRVSRDGIVLKPAHGLQGRGVTFSKRYQDAIERTRSIQWRDPNAFVSEHYLAQPIVGEPGRDIRAFVVGDICVALASRISTMASEPRANMSLGGRAEALPLTHPAASLAEAAARALGLDYAGVDIVENTGGELCVLEVDAWAGFAGLERASGVDIAGSILDLTLDKLRYRS